MPTTDVDGRPIATRIAHNPGGRDFPFLEAREPFGRHVFLGGNTFLKRLLRDNADEFDVASPSRALERSIEHSLEFLRHETARIALGDATVEDGRMTIPVTVHNLGGHKLPTAYPSRRAWIELTVTDAGGKTVFASGRYNAGGELIDSGGRVLPSERAGGPVVPHLSIVDSPDQVQVYETIMGDAGGEPTFVLLRGATYVKDNRLLPLGWDAEHADGPATRPFGIGEDGDFTGGSDTVLYRVPVSGDGEFSVTAKLLFQTISPRHAGELFLHDTPQIRTFKGIFEKADRKPETLAEITLEVPCL